MIKDSGNRRKLKGEKQMIDCSNTKNYLKEKNRMTKTNEDGNCMIECENCPLYSRNNGKEIICLCFEAQYPSEAIDIVQKWSDENPRHTYKDDFLAKFPNAPTEADGTPKCCLKNIYITGGHDFCAHSRSECYKCWNEVMPE